MVPASRRLTAKADASGLRLPSVPRLLLVVADQFGLCQHMSAADQMLVFLALAAGPSAFRATELALHARTATWLFEKLMPARFSITAGWPARQEDTWSLQVTPETKTGLARRSAGKSERARSRRWRGATAGWRRRR